MCVCTHAAYRNAVAMDWHFIDRQLGSTFEHIYRNIRRHIVVTAASTNSAYRHAVSVIAIAACSLVRPIVAAAIASILVASLCNHSQCMRMSAS